MSDVRSYFLGNYLVHQDSTRTLVFLTFVKLCVYFTSFISPVRLIFFFLLFIYGYFTMKKKNKAEKFMSSTMKKLEIELRLSWYLVYDCTCI